MDVHNVTVYAFSHTSNTQRDNTNAILTSEKLDKSDDLAETLNYLTINDSEYYISDSVNANNEKGDPASNPKTVTHTSGGNKRKVENTSNETLQQKLLSNRTLPVVTTTMDPRIDNRIATCGGTSHALTTPVTKEVIAGATHGSARVNRTPRHVSWMCRDCSTPGDTCMSLRSTRANCTVLIGSPYVSPVCGIIESLQVGNKL